MKGIQSIDEKKVLLIDDEKDILNLLETVLNKEGFKSIYKAQNGMSGIEKCKKIKPNIIILDIMLPDIDGFQVLTEIRKFSNCPVIFLSAKSDDVDKILGFGLGGDDYVTKPFSPKEVAYRIKAYFRRADYMEESQFINKNNQQIKFNNIVIDKEKAQVSRAGSIVNLTAKEYQLLLYLVDNRNIILSKDKILEEVWGMDFDGYDNTLMVHIRRLREKIEDNPSSPQYIKTFKGLGYKFIMGD